MCHIKETVSVVEPINDEAQNIKFSPTSTEELWEIAVSDANVPTVW